MKRLISILLAVLMLLSCFAGVSFSASAAEPPENGWYLDDGIWYYYENGEYTTGWKYIGKSWYYFDYDGWMAADGVWNIDDTHYYFSKSGAMQTDWIKSAYTYDDGETSVTWYYAKSNGALLNGWQSIGGKWYFFDEEYYYMYSDGITVDNDKEYYLDKSGAMQTGWIKHTVTYSDGDSYTLWYYANSNGVLAEGWKSIGGKWYYFYPEMSTSTHKENGKLYSFDKSGAMIANGWGQDAYGNWHYADKSGVCRTGWQKISGKWYYFHPDTGEMYIGIWRINNKLYFFGSDGAWIKKPAEGWNGAKITRYSSDGTDRSYTEWVYVKNGTFVTGWQKISGKWYYFDKEWCNMYADGASYIPESGKYYFFNADGSLREKAGWVSTNNDWGYGGYSVDVNSSRTVWYYLNADGSCVTGWKRIGSTWYYLEPSMAANTYCHIDDSNGDDKIYIFASNGAWISKTGWAKVSDIWYYVQKDGTCTTGWLDVNGKTYWFDEDGWMVTGIYTIDGFVFRFADSGELVENLGPEDEYYN